VVNAIRRYDIVIEQRLANSSAYSEYLRETTENHFLEFSIPAGNYRYKVLGYNILNRLGAESEYQSFEVLQAIQPVIRTIHPNQTYVTDDPFTLTLTGERFVLGGELYLIPESSNSSDNSSTQSGVIFPSDISFNEAAGTAELLFDGKDLPIDTFRIVAVNPGGLRTYGFFRVLPLPPFVAPRVISPENNHVFSINELAAANGINFTWQPVEEANQYTFALYTRDSLDNLTPLLENQSLSGTSYSLKDLSILDSGTFVWRLEARSLNNDGSLNRPGNTAELTFMIDLPAIGTIETKDPGILYGN
jgi:hypothetical protein